jgi:hypothetical protein
MYASIRILFLISFVFQISFAQNNRALKIGSSGDFLSIQDGPELRPEQFTIELWFKRYSQIDNTQPDYPVFSKSGISMSLTGQRFPNNLTASLEGDGGIHVSSGTPIWPDRWYHVALIFDGEQAMLYLDGSLSDSVSTEWCSVPEIL